MPELQVMVAKARAGAHGGHPRHLAFLVLGMAGLALTGSANGGAGSPGGWRWSPAHNGLRLRVETIRDTVLEGQELPLRLRFQVDPPSRPDSVMRLNGDARAWRWEFRWTHGSDGATFTSGFSGEVRPGDPCRRETCLQPIDRLEDMSIPIQLRAQDCRVFPPGPYRLDVHYVNSGQLTSEFDRSRWKAHPGAWSGRLAAPPVWFTIQADTALTTRFVLPGSLCILADQGNYYCVWGRQDSLVLQLPHRPGGHYVMHRRLGLRGADAASGEYLQGLSGGAGNGGRYS